MTKKIIITSGIILILIGLFFLFSQKNNPSTKNNSKEDIISDIIEPTKTINYDDLGINPNDYESFTWFLVELENFTWVDVKVTEENFVACKKNDDGTITYIPFRQWDINSDIFASKTNKNLAIIDIYQAYKDDCLAGSKWSSASQIVIFEEEVWHSETSTINDIHSKKTNINRLIKELENVWKNSNNKKELLSYLYEFKWEYKKAAINRAKNCKEDSELCDKEVKITIRGKILDQDNNPIEWATIKFLNNTKAQVKSNEKWLYSMTFKYFPFSHLRFKASINGYSDGFNTIVFNTYTDPNWWNRKEENFTLHKAHKTYSVDTNSNENISTKDKKDYYLFETKQSKYWVPIDWLYFEDGMAYEGANFDVYLYEFTKQSNMESLLNNDTFNPVYWYVGNIMKTFGMPYIQFIDQDTKRELFVKSSNHIILENQIYHMQELYDNADKIYEALTEEDMEYLVEVSKEEWGYPIDFQWLTENEFLRWPAWWVLDRKKWIWENIWCKVINKDWLVELPFYSINE